MPWWWNRRRRYWHGRFRRRRRRRPLKRRRFRYTTYRRRPRIRRRRRRKRRVRKKKQTITVKQWQPDSITRCKIKGVGVMVLGADGRQMYCYTDEKDSTVPPRTPTGGGFGVEVFSLKYLYEEYKFHNNIWTKTNIYKDLVRYLYCKFTFYRHSHIDFVISYDRQPPFTLNKLTYASTHPHQLLQHKHKRLLLSTSTNPTGKLTKKFFVKPPKQMISKWFFQQNFCKYPLVQFRAAALDLRYSYLGCCNENQQLGIYYLDQTFYALADWGLANLPSSKGYKPWSTAPDTVTITGKILDQQKTVTVNSKTYPQSVSYTEGWFQPDLLKLTTITNPPQRANPINTCIYNLNLDDGIGNAVYITGITSPNYDQPQADQSVTIAGLPLWLALFGYFNYLTESKKTKEYYKLHCVMLKSKALLPHPQTGASQTILPIDPAFINGKRAYDQIPTISEKTRWYPTMESQINTLNSIVEASPFIPKFKYGETKSTWELKYFYNFCFKWGGPMLTDADVADPCQQGKYDVPDTIRSRLQIQNPEKIKTETLIHNWDIRRGFIKETALKRMSEHLSIDTDFQPDCLDYQPPKKKRYLPKITAQEEEKQEILQCLRSLCESSTYQEETEEDLHKLIQHQQQQQHKLKRHLLELLSDMKHQQRMLQLQTGIIE
nr:MAG: ORF1 [Torque teno midi virus]